MPYVSVELFSLNFSTVPILSLCFLAATFGIFCYFKELRDTHGLCCLHFSASMIMSGLWFFCLRSSNGNVATLAIVFVSSSEAASIGWLAVMAFDVCLDAVRFDKPREQETKYKFLFYCAFVYIMTLVHTIAMCELAIYNQFNEFLYFFVALPIHEIFYASTVMLMFAGYSIFKSIKPSNEADSSRLRKLKIR